MFEVCVLIQYSKLDLFFQSKIVTASASNA